MPDLMIQAWEVVRRVEILAKYEQLKRGLPWDY